MFSLSYDPERVLLTVVQAGYWDMPEFRNFETQFLAVHRRIRAQRKCYRVIADCRDFPVQSGEIGEAFAIMFRTLMAENLGHYAIIAATTLNKMQAKRAIPQTNVEVFSADEMDKAMAWLFEDGSLPE